MQRLFYNPDKKISEIDKLHSFPSGVSQHVDQINLLIRTGKVEKMSDACKCSFFHYRNLAEKYDRDNASDDIAMEGIAAGISGPMHGYNVEAMERDFQSRTDKLDAMEQEFKSVCSMK